MNKNSIKVIIPTAGKGTRSGLNYPKTLYKVDGKEILLHILELTNHLDRNPTIIVSRNGFSIIKNFLDLKKINAELIIQDSPKGMGDALLQFKKSCYYEKTENILLIWGDIPFIKISTIESIITCHFENKNAFTLISKHVNKAYTLIKRDKNNKIIHIKETREEGEAPTSGERDIGLFLFKKKIVFQFLQKELSGKYGKASNEHGFLYIVEHLAKKGYKIEALPIAEAKELISLNYMSDLEI